MGVAYFIGGKMIKSAVLKIKKQYKGSFFFGFKLVILLSLFLVVPFIAYMVSSTVDNITQKIPFLYISPLRITSMQNYEFEIKPKYWGDAPLTSGQTLYFSINRRLKNLDEYEAAQKEAVELINNTYSVKQITVEKGIIYSFPDYYGTAIYGRHTSIGNFVIVPFNIILVILCLASYFPLFKAIFNLFRFKRIFKEE